LVLDLCEEFIILVLDLCHVHLQRINTRSRTISTTSLVVGTDIYGRDHDKRVIIDSLTSDINDRNQPSIPSIEGMEGVWVRPLLLNMYSMTQRWMRLNLLSKPEFVFQMNLMFSRYQEQFLRQLLNQLMIVEIWRWFTKN